MAKRSKSMALPTPLASAPAPLRKIFADAEVYPDLSGEDLREMAKFTEETNVQGLAVHPIERPPRSRGLRETDRPLAGLPRRLLREIGRGVREGPHLLIQGKAAASCRRPFVVAATVPQSHAHLAHGLHELLWPDPKGEPAASADLLLIYLPDFEPQTLLFAPDDGVALILGTDDLRAGLLVAIESAHRCWSGGRVSEEEEKPSEIQLLPGGCVVIHGDGDDADAGATLAFCNESYPDTWARVLIEELSPLGDHGTSALEAAGAEPWVAHAGGEVSPFWRNPPLPAALLAGSPAWTRAALEPGALPFGVRVDEAGSIDLAASHADAFLVVPRRSIPRPFPDSTAPLKIDRLVTYGYAKNDAMKLWTVGFPTPEVI